MMYSIEADNFNEAYPAAIDATMRFGDIVPSRNGTTREIHPAIITVNSPHQRLVTSFARPINVAFALAEVLWILTGRNDVKMLSYYNSQIRNYSDDGKTFNAAYGYRLRHSFGHDQIEDVIATLSKDHDSRQATLVLSHPTYDKGWIAPLNRLLVTKDRACNIVSHLLIRNGKLDWLQVVRSNDAIWGTPYNWMQFTHLMEYIAGGIGVEMGRYFHIADSFHIYEQHWEEAKRIELFDLYEVTQFDHEQLKYLSESGLNSIVDLETQLRKAPNASTPTGLPEGWENILSILQAHSLYKEDLNEETYYKLATSGDLVYSLAQIRFYWFNRWYKDEAITSVIEDDWPDNIVQWIIADHA